VRPHGRLSHSVAGRALLLGLAVLLAASAGRAQASAAQDQADTLKQADIAFRAGYAAMQAGDLQQARVRFGEVVRLAPQIPEGHAALGEVLFEAGIPADAAAQFEDALRLKPNDPAVEANLALAYSKAAEPAKAIAPFAAAWQASRQAGGLPVSAEFCVAYGRALAATGLRAEAIQLFQEAIRRGSSTARSSTIWARSMPRELTGGWPNRSLRALWRSIRLTFRH
jgi:protein O-GlcNAc transferase